MRGESENSDEMHSEDTQEPVVAAIRLFGAAENLGRTVCDIQNVWGETNETSVEK